MESRMPYFVDKGQSWHLALYLILSAVNVFGARKAFAQQETLPFADPAKMFEQMFGEDSEEDRRDLEKIEVSIEEERQLGNQLVDGALALLKSSSIEVESDGVDVEYLQSLVSILQPLMRNKKRYSNIRVLVARSPRIDARSYPGGTLIFFDGLLQSVDNEAALVGIVGHEMSHLDRGHQLLPIKRIKLMEKSFSSPDAATRFSPSQPGMAKLWARPFRPEDERDADRDGVMWSYALGYDPRELAKLFQKKGGKAGATEELPWSTFFRSHPYDHDRQQAILKEFKQLKKQKPHADPLFIGRENLLNRVSREQAEK